jgi:hypothetical protein
MKDLPEVVSHDLTHTEPSNVVIAGLDERLLQSGESGLVWTGDAFLVLKLAVLNHTAVAEQVRHWGKG